MAIVNTCKRCSDDLVPFYVIAGGFGLLGSRLLHFVFAEPANFFSNPLIFFDVGQGGFAFLGGVIGGVVSGAAYCRWRQIPFWKVADIGAAAVMLALAVGRVGCFFAGCCHGRLFDSVNTAGMDVSPLLSLPGGEVVTVEVFPWIAFIFEAGIGVGSIHDVPIYPTQMMEFITGLTLFVVLTVIWKRWRFFDGQVLATMLVLYAGARIAIEEYRGDTVRGVDYLGMLSTSQLVSCVLCLFALGIVAARIGKGVAEEVPFVPELEE